jgi:hypothetical protein
MKDRITAYCDINGVWGKVIHKLSKEATIRPAMNEIQKTKKKQKKKKEEKKKKKSILCGEVLAGNANGVEPLDQAVLRIARIRILSIAWGSEWEEGRKKERKKERKQECKKEKKEEKKKSKKESKKARKQERKKENKKKRKKESKKERKKA